VSRNPGNLRLADREGTLRALTIGAVILLVCCVGGIRVEAQEVASSFGQLAVLVKPGDQITVVDANGRAMEGRIETLSRDAMTLLTPYGLRALRDDDVTTIRQRRDDSLRNGAMIGAVAAAAYVATALILLRDADGGDLNIPMAVKSAVVIAGVGAGAGAGIDALIVRRRVIFQKPGASTVRVSPLFRHGRLGAAVSVGF
jgi:hypothetical protein